MKVANGLGAHRWKKMLWRASDPHLLGHADEDDALLLGVGGGGGGGGLEGGGESPQAAGGGGLHAGRRCFLDTARTGTSLYYNSQSSEKRRRSHIERLHCI